MFRGPALYNPLKEATLHFLVPCIRRRRKTCLELIGRLLFNGASAIIRDIIFLPCSEFLHNSILCYAPSLRELEQRNALGAPRIPIKRI
jgi:hypothetical protein